MQFRVGAVRRDAIKKWTRVCGNRMLRSSSARIINHLYEGSMATATLSKPKTKKPIKRRPKSIPLRTRSNTHRSARRYYLAGRYPIPLCSPDDNGECGDGRGHKGKEIGKAPLIRYKEFEEEPPSLEQIDEWWERWPDANVGILLRPSGLFVIDADGPEGWAEVKELGFGNGPRFKTGNGRQLLYRAPDGVAGRKIKCGVSRSIDILAEGYIVTPPSRHRNGRSYEWEVFLEEEGLRDPPEWAVRMLSGCSTMSLTRSVELPDDLPIVEVDGLRVSDRIKRLIRDGEDSSRYPSRSEPVFAVIQALIDAEYSDEVMAAVLLKCYRTPPWTSCKPCACTA